MGLAISSCLLPRVQLEVLVGQLPCSLTTPPSRALEPGQQQQGAAEQPSVQQESLLAGLAAMAGGAPQQRQFRRPWPARAQGLQAVVEALTPPGPPASAEHSALGDAAEAAALPPVADLEGPCWHLE